LADALEGVETRPLHFLGQQLDLHPRQVLGERLSNRLLARVRRDFLLLLLGGRVARRVVLGRLGIETERQAQHRESELLVARR
jgi:hypothetical protein